MFRHISILVITIIIGFLNIVKYLCSLVNLLIPYLLQLLQDHNLEIILYPYFCCFNILMSAKFKENNFHHPLFQLNL